MSVTTPAAWVQIAMSVPGKIARGRHRAKHEHRFVVVEDAACQLVVGNADSPEIDMVPQDQQLEEVVTGGIIVRCVFIEDDIPAAGGVPAANTTRLAAEARIDPRTKILTAIERHRPVRRRIKGTNDESCAARSAGTEDS